jgi:hypothetical protein
MKMHNMNNPKRLLGFLSYGIGVAVGFFLIFVATWADIEANSYDFPRLANAGLGGLRCPVLMTPDETSTISLNVSNPTGNQISPAIKVLISTRLLPEEFLEGIQLMPGEAKRLEWTVDSEHIDLGNFILAKVLLYSAYPLPSREATCGIFVLNLPGTGRVLVPVLMVLSFLSMGWGLYNLNRLRAVHGRLNKYMGLITFLAIIISLGLVLSFIGGWLSSVLVLVVALLLIIILLGSFATDKAR